MNLLDIFKNSGGWFEGHTLFKNGLHGNGWVEKGFVIKNPILFEKIISAQAEQINKYFPNVELLVGPAINGSIVASHLSRILKIEFAITYGKDKDIEFHRMNIPKKRLKIVLVEDLVFTGNDVKNNIKFLKDYGLNVLGVSTWINRSEELSKNNNLISLIDHPPFKQYLLSECPMCKNNIPVKYENIRE